MGAGCEGGRCGFLLPASRISTKDRKGHEGKRRRRSQGDDRKSGPRTAAGADWEQGRSSLQPARCAPSFVQFTVSEPELEEIMAAFRCFDTIQMQLPWRRGGQPGMGAGCEGGGDRAIRTGNRRGIGKSRIRIDDAGAGNSRTRVYERLRTFTNVDECLRTLTSVCERLRAFASVYERLRVLTSVDECLRAFARKFSES